jgi:hypothetical protein
VIDYFEIRCPPTEQTVSQTWRELGNAASIVRAMRDFSVKNSA